MPSAKELVTACELSILYFSLNMFHEGLEHNQIVNHCIIKQQLDNQKFIFMSWWQLY